VFRDDSILHWSDTMKRTITTLMTGALALLLVAAPALAQSDHWINASASVSSSTGALVASFKVAGLGNNVEDTFTLTATATAVYQCFNNGGNHPKAGNKETVTAPVSGTGTFSSGKNGTISNSISAGPPGPGGFACPSGQTLFLQTVTYTDVSLTDNQGAGAAPISSGPYSSGTLHIPV
jgi:hypothetical protein